MKKIVGSFVILIALIIGVFFFFDAMQTRKIVDASGEPVASAYIVIGDEVMKTDEKGRWGYDGEETSFYVLAQGYETLLTSSSELRSVLTAEPALSRLVFIHDENGPVSDAYLVVLDPNTYQLSAVHQTDVDGFAWFPELSQGWTFFFVYKEGYQQGWMYADINDENDPVLAFELTPGSSGTVSSPLSSSSTFIPIAHAQVDEPSVNLRDDAPALANDVVVFKRDIKALIVEVQEHIAEAREDFDTHSIGSQPTAVSLSPLPPDSALYQFLEQEYNERLLTPEGFFGPITSSSTSWWKGASQYIDPDEFYGPITRSHLSTFSFFVPSSPSYEDEEDSVYEDDPDDVVIIGGGRIYSPADDEAPIIDPIPPIEVEIELGAEDEYEIRINDESVEISENEDGIEIDISAITLVSGTTVISSNDDRGTAEFIVTTEESTELEVLPTTTDVSSDAEDSTCAESWIYGFPVEDPSFLPVGCIPPDGSSGWDCYSFEEPECSTSTRCFCITSPEDF